MTTSAVRVLHLVPKSFLSDEHRYLGSSKDIAARVQYFEDRGLAFDLVAHDKTEATTLEALAPVDLRAYTHTLVERANYGAVFRYLRSEAPRAKILYRSINAEVPHRMEYVRACLAPPRRRSPRAVWQQCRNVPRYGGRDLSAARHADRILSISEWDTRHYWRHLARARASTIPFFLPRRCMEEAKPAPRKKRLCIVLGSSQPGPLIEHGINQFYRCLAASGSAPYEDAGWRFIISGARTGRMPRNAELKALGVAQRNVDSPYELLAPARAALIASDLGRGCKTKILEAATCAAFVICPPRLLRRQPPELLPYCLPFDPGSPDTLLQALRQTEGGFPAGAPNDLLQATAYREMDRVFGLA